MPSGNWLVSGVRDGAAALAVALRLEFCSASGCVPPRGWCKALRTWCNCLRFISEPGCAPLAAADRALSAITDRHKKASLLIFINSLPVIVGAGVEAPPLFFGAFFGSRGLVGLAGPSRTAGSICHRNC